MRAFALFCVGVLALVIAMVIVGAVYQEAQRQAFNRCLLTNAYGLFTPDQMARRCIKEVYE